MSFVLVVSNTSKRTLGPFCHNVEWNCKFWMKLYGKTPETFVVILHDVVSYGKHDMISYILKYIFVPVNVSTWLKYEVNSKSWLK